MPNLNEAQTAQEQIYDPAQSSHSSLHVVRRLRRAFLSICRCGDVMFSPYRLTTEQYSLMRAVLREPGVRQVDIKDRIFAEPNTVTAMVTLLERRGIIRRKPSPIDGRARLLYLTAHGQTVMTRLYEDWEPMRQVIRKCFAGKNGETALEILDTVYNEMERAREKLVNRSWSAPAELEPNPASTSSPKKARPGPAPASPRKRKTAPANAAPRDKRGESR